MSKELDIFCFFPSQEKGKKYKNLCALCASGVISASFEITSFAVKCAFLLIFVNGEPNNPYD
jgi:uncharacterized protein (UPF0210 family)